MAILKILSIIIFFKKSLKFHIFVNLIHIFLLPMSMVNIYKLILKEDSAKVIFILFALHNMKKCAKMIVWSYYIAIQFPYHTFVCKTINFLSKSCLHLIFQPLKCSVKITLTINHLCSHCVFTNINMEIFILPLWLFHKG